MWSLYQQHRHPWELVRNVLFQAYTGILNQQLWGQSPATHVLKNPSSDSYWIWFGKNAAATEENEVWKKFIILTGPRESVTTWYAGPQGTTLSGKKAEDRMSGSLGQNLYQGFQGKAREGTANSLGLASFSKSGGLWAIVVASSCLVPSPGMIQGRGNISLVCESQIRRQLGI